MKEALLNFFGFIILLFAITALAFSTRKITAIMLAQQTKCWNTLYRDLVLNYTVTLLKQRNLTNSVQNLTIEYCNTLLARK